MRQRSDSGHERAFVMFEIGRICGAMDFLQTAGSRRAITASPSLIPLAASEYPIFSWLCRVVTYGKIGFGGPMLEELIERLNQLKIRSEDVRRFL